MVQNAVFVGQSVLAANAYTQLNNLPNYDISDLTPNGPPPSWALDGVDPTTITDVIRFPSDTPPYYMCLGINNYSRQDWRSVGQLSEVARVILPLPAQMIDNHNVKYDVEALGIGGAVGFDSFATGQNASQIAQLATVGLVKGALGAAQGATGAAGAVAGKLFTGQLAASGVAVNDFMTVMLKGPDYKRRDFQWRFAPQTAAETYALRRIIQLLNNSMAPALFGVGSAFFAWPKIFQPEFVYQGIPNLLALNTFRMKPSVMTDFSINYTPNGVFSPFASTKAPTSVEIRMSFFELEYWLAGNFNDVPSEDLGSAANSVAESILTGQVVTTPLSQLNQGTADGLNSLPPFATTTF